MASGVGLQGSSNKRGLRGHSAVTVPKATRFQNAGASGSRLLGPHGPPHVPVGGPAPAGDPGHTHSGLCQAREAPRQTQEGAGWRLSDRSADRGFVANAEQVISAPRTRRGISRGRRRGEEARSLQVNASPCPERGSGPLSRASTAQGTGGPACAPASPRAPSSHHGPQALCTCLVPAFHDPQVSPESLLSPHLCPGSL